WDQQDKTAGRSQDTEEPPVPDWGPPEDDWMPNQDPWQTSQQPPNNQPSQPSAPEQPAAPVQQSASQSKQPASPEPAIATGPDPIADDGYAGFIPRQDASDEPAIPAFAKSEAELREEFQRRFGNVIPGGTDNKPQQQQTKPASGSRFAEMVAQYGGQQPNGTQTESGPQEEKTPDEDDDDYASDDDEIIEDSGLAGRSVVESLLNARLVEERNADGTPKL